MTGRRSKRSNTNISTEDVEPKNELNDEDCSILPVAASSPQPSYELDPEDEEVINTARNNLELIKREVSRQVRLAKFKLGQECLKLPFTKEFFAKNVYECQQKSQRNSISGPSSISFTNAVSSTGNFSKIQEKNTSHETRSRIADLSKSFKSKGNSLKEVTFQDSTFEMPKKKMPRGIESVTDETSGDATSNSTFKIPPSKKRGRAVAFVTPGPDVDRSLNILRRPRTGELAVSLFGSPLLVAPDCAPTAMPQINLPTADGKVVAILPRGGFTVDDMPSIATPTRHQLKTLNKYLNDLCQQQDKIKL